MVDQYIQAQRYKLHFLSYLFSKQNGCDLFQIFPWNRRDLCNWLVGIYFHEVAESLQAFKESQGK